MNRLTIGKTLNNDIVISDDPTISRAHAELIIGEENFIVDLNSTNGTFVNGVKIVDKQKLNSLDVIRVGNSLVDWSAYMYDNTVIDFGVDKTIVDPIEEKPKEEDVKKVTKFLTNRLTILEMVHKNSESLFKLPQFKQQKE